MSYPHRNFRFRLEIDSIDRGGFMECSGFGSEVEVVEYREGGDIPHVRKLPGKTSYSDITLRWGIVGQDADLYAWHRSAIDGTVNRRNGSIILLDDEGEEAARWNFFQAWPSRYEPPSLDAAGSDIAVDALTIVYERLERA